MTETALEAFRRTQKENNDEIKSALKLQELIKKRIEDLNNINEENFKLNQIDKEPEAIQNELQKLLEESKK